MIKLSHFLTVPFLGRGTFGTSVMPRCSAVARRDATLQFDIIHGTCVDSSI